MPWGLSVVGLAIAAAALWTVAGRPALDAPLWLPWPVLAVLVFAAERSAFHLHFRGSSLSFTLSEAPIALGLFLVGAVPLVVARTLGGFLALVLTQRQDPPKLVFNLAQYAAEAAVAVAVFRALIGDADPMGLRGVGAAFAGVTAAAAVTLTLVHAAIRRTRGDPGSLVRLYFRSLPITLANTAIALSVLVTAWLRPALVWLPLVPLGILLLSYRAYVDQRRNRESLGFLYDTAVAVHGEDEVRSALVALANATASHLHAQIAELALVPDHPARPVRLVASVLGVEQMWTGPVTALPDDVRSQVLGQAPAPTRGPELWARAAVERVGTLLLRVSRPTHPKRRFDETDAGVLRALARLAVTTVERTHLEELKGAFLSAVSHELRTPLTVVRTGASTLRLRGSRLSRQQQDELVARIDAQARRLERLLGDLLDLDRLDRDALQPRRREVNVRALAEEVVATVRPPGHAVSVRGHEVISHVDPALTERIIENLLVNATKYSPPGTSVWIDVTDDGRNGAVVIVEDEGPGIPAQQRDAVLQPFTRLDLAHPSPGTGIGLTLVERFADIHGGGVRIEDGASGGARVIVTLPNAPVSAPSEPASGRSADPPTPQTDSPRGPDARSSDSPV